MDYLTELVADVEERIDDITTIGDVNEELIKIAVGNLESIRQDLTATGKNKAILQKVERQISLYDQVAGLPAVKEKLPVIREQMVVLIIGAMEVFIADVFKTIAQNDPDFFIWPDKKEKISFDPALLTDGFTFGDVLINHLKNKGFNFQDLHSTLKAIEKYCGIEIVIEEDFKEILILSAAYRHVIVHNRSTIDNAFLHQIRATRSAQEENFQKEQKISVNQDFIIKLKGAAKSFCGQVVDHLIQRNEVAEVEGAEQ